MIEAPSADALIVALATIFTFIALVSALLLVTISLRRPRTGPLVAASALVVLCVLVFAVVPVPIPTIAGLFIALLGTALAAVGGNPVVRRVLRLAEHGTVPEGPRGGILIASGQAQPETEILRGGTTIGYLERLGTVLAIIAGYPAAIAVIVAVKGIGRFSELSTSAARERFIVGTLASLLWACVVGALVHLALR